MSFPECARELLIAAKYMLCGVVPYTRSAKVAGERELAREERERLREGAKAERELAAEDSERCAHSKCRGSR